MIQYLIHKLRLVIKWYKYSSEFDSARLISRFSPNPRVIYFMADESEPYLNCVD